MICSSFLTLDVEFQLLIQADFFFGDQESASFSKLMHQIFFPVVFLGETSYALIRKLQIINALHSDHAAAGGLWVQPLERSVLQFLYVSTICTHTVMLTYFTHLFFAFYFLL